MFGCDRTGDGVGMDHAALLLKCEELIAFLSAHPDKRKLVRLLADIEALRDRLLDESRPDLQTRG